MKLESRNSSWSVFSSDRCVLGEGPVWSSIHNGLFWVDILRKHLYFKDMDERFQCWNLDFHASALSVEDVDTIFLVCEVGVAKFSLSSGIAEIICSVEEELDETRSNDGGADPSGRFWFGTMAWSADNANGSIYSYRSDEGLRKQLTHWGIPNTFCWSPDGEEMFIGDSMKSQIYRFDYNPDEGQISGKSIFIDDSIYEYVPDGSVIDSRGNLWNAKWDGSKVSCYLPSGEMSLEIFAPVQRPTSLAIGGNNNDKLFLTSASDGISSDRLEREPLSGCVLMLDLREAHCA